MTTCKQISNQWTWQQLSAACTHGQNEIMNECGIVVGVRWSEISPLRHLWGSRWTAGPSLALQGRGELVDSSELKGSIFNTHYDQSMKKSISECAACRGHTLVNENSKKFTDSPKWRSLKMFPGDMGLKICRDICPVGSAWIHPVHAAGVGDIVDGHVHPQTLFFHWSS